MTNWCEIRERYVRGGITQEALAKEYNIAASTVRRKSALEGWAKLRAKRSGVAPKGDDSAARTRMEKQLELTDALLEKLIACAKSDSELYFYIDERKTGDGAYEFLAEKLPVLNEERVLKLVKAADELVLLQRTALGIPDIKDELAGKKLEQDSEIAAKKLELELMKIDGGSVGEEPDGFLEALGLSGTQDSGSDELTE